MSYRPSLLFPQDFPCLSNFTCKAVVDFIKIGIVTLRNTNANTIRLALLSMDGVDTRIYVHPIDVGLGNAAQKFVFTIQEPKSVASLARILENLEKRFPFASQPQIVELEIAVDFYSKTNNRADLESMVLRLIRELAHSGTNPRQFVPMKNHKNGRMRFLTNDCERIDARDTFYAGNKLDAIMWRIYLKITDNNRKPLVNQSEHRARMEVKLQGDALAAYFTDLDSLRDARFETLAQKFKCRAFVPREAEASLSPFQKHLAQIEGNYTMRDWQVGQHILTIPKRRKYSSDSRADVELNVIVRGALRA